MDKSSSKKKIKKYMPPKKPSAFEEQEKYLKKLLELYEREKQTRCYFQLERDKLIQLREIEKTKYNEMKDKYLVMSEKLAKLEHAHDQEMSTMSTKVQYLISEHQMKLNEFKIKINNNKNECLIESIDKDNKFLSDIRKNFNELNEKCLNYDEFVKNISRDYEIQISKLNLNHSDTIKDVQAVCSSRFKEEREKFSLVTRNAINELNELKNTQLTSMIEIKNQSFNELKSYFQKLTKNVIESVEKLQEKLALAERSLKEKQRELDKCSKELEETKKENSLIKDDFNLFTSKCRLYDSDSKIYKAKSKQFEILNNQYKDLDLKYEELLFAYEKIRLERDNLNKHLTNLVRLFKEKLETFKFISNKKNEFLEEKLLSYEKILS